jgi:hypothetical protein
VEETNTERAARVERANKKREEEFKKIPLQEIDDSKWPSHVRQIALSEAGGLGVDSSGRLYWNGKPVEIVGRRIDLTWTQLAVAIAVAIFTGLAAAATTVQAAVAYQDWACKNKQPSIIACPTPVDEPARHSPPDSD